MIAEFNDKSRVYKCEVNGAILKVFVQYLNNGKYLVYPRSKTKSGYTGVVYTDSYEKAARKACGE